MVNQYKEKIRRFDCAVKIVILDDELEFSKILDKKIKEYCARKDLLYDCQIFSSGKTLLEDDLFRKWQMLYLLIFQMDSFRIIICLLLILEYVHIKSCKLFHRIV